MGNPGLDWINLVNDLSLLSPSTIEDANGRTHDLLLHDGTEVKIFVESKGELLLNGELFGLAHYCPELEYSVLGDLILESYGGPRRFNIWDTVSVLNEEGMEVEKDVLQI